MTVEDGHGQRLQTSLKNTNVVNQNTYIEKKVVLIKLSHLGEKLTEHFKEIYHNNSKVVINKIISRY